MFRSRTAFGVVSLSLLLALPVSAGWDEGVAAFSSKNYEKAAAEFRTVVDQNPGGYRGHYMLGASLQRLGRKEEALGHLRKAYDLSPSDVAVKFELAKSYHSVRKYREVIDLLAGTDVASLQPAQKAVLYQIRGEAYLRTDNMQGAYDDFRNVAKLNPKDADVQYSFGTVALKADQTNEAVAALTEAVRLDAADADKKKALVNALIKQGRIVPDKAAKKTSYTKAAEVAGQLVASAPNFDNLMLKMSAEIGAGLFLAAIQTGEQAQAKNAQDWLVPFYIGQAYTGSDQYDKAIPPLKKAQGLATNPADKKKVMQQLGFNYEKQKNYAEAVAIYQAAGDSAAVARVQENEKTAKFNNEVDAQLKERDALEKEKKALEEQMKKLQGGGGGGI